MSDMPSSDAAAAASPSRTVVLSESQLFYAPPNIPLKGAADNLTVINWLLDKSQTAAGSMFGIGLSSWLFSMESDPGRFSWKIGEAARLARYPYWFSVAMWLWSLAPLVGFTRALLVVRRSLPGASLSGAYRAMAERSPGMPLAAEAAITTQVALTIAFYWLRNPTSNIISNCAFPAAFWVLYKAWDRYHRPQKNMLNLWPENLSQWNLVHGLTLLASTILYRLLSASSSMFSDVTADRVAVALGWLGALCVKRFLRTVQTEVMNTDWLIDEVSKQHVERTKQAQEDGRSFGSGPHVVITGHQ